MNNVIKIGNFTFENYPLDAYKALHLLADITPYIGRLYEGLTTEEGVSVDEIIRAVTGLGIPGDQLETILKTLLSKTQYNKKPLDLDGFEWSRNLFVILRLAIEVLKLEYHDFLAGAGLIPEVAAPLTEKESDN